MHHFKKIQFTKPIELLFLVISTVVVFLGSLFLFKDLIESRLLILILGLSISIVYFFWVKNYFIIKEMDFVLTNNQLKWGKEFIDFENIEYYKFHWQKGAGIKFKLKNGKVVRLSANENFCNPDNFVMMCSKIVSKLKRFRPEIIRKYSFFETKKGFYFALIMTILSVLAVIFKLFSEGEFKIGVFGFILSSLATIWLGVKWKKKI